MERELFHLGQKRIRRVAFKKLATRRNTTLYLIEEDFIYYYVIYSSFDDSDLDFT